MENRNPLRVYCKEIPARQPGLILCGRHTPVQAAGALTGIQGTKEAVFAGEHYKTESCR